MTLRPLAPVLITLALAACSTPVAPVFHTLQEPIAGVPATSAPYAIEVMPVKVPAQVDQPQVVLSAADGVLLMLQGERWAAPLSDEIHAAVSGALSHRLGAPDVSGIGAGSLPVWRVQLDVQRFAIALGQPAVLQATWRVRNLSGDGTALLCSSQIAQTPDTPDVNGAILAQRAALTRLAEVIAASIDNQGHAPTGALAQATRTRCNSVPGAGGLSR